MNKRYSDIEAAANIGKSVKTSNKKLSLKRPVDKKTGSASPVKKAAPAKKPVAAKPAEKPAPKTEAKPATKAESTKPANSGKAYQPALPGMRNLSQFKAPRGK